MQAMFRKWRTPWGRGGAFSWWTYGVTHYSVYWTQQWQQCRFSVSRSPNHVDCLVHAASSVCVNDDSCLAYHHVGTEATGKSPVRQVLWRFRRGGSSRNITWCPIADDSWQPSFGTDRQAYPPIARAPTNSYLGRVRLKIEVTKPLSESWPQTAPTDTTIITLWISRCRYLQQDHLRLSSSPMRYAFDRLGSGFRQCSDPTTLWTLRDRHILRSPLSFWSGFVTFSMLTTFIFNMKGQSSNSEAPRCVSRRLRQGQDLAWSQRAERDFKCQLPPDYSKAHIRWIDHPKTCHSAFSLPSSRTEFGAQRGTSSRIRKEKGYRRCPYAPTGTMDAPTTSSTPSAGEVPC